MATFFISLVLILLNANVLTVRIQPSTQSLVSTKHELDIIKGMYIDCYKCVFLERTLHLFNVYRNKTQKRNSQNHTTKVMRFVKITGNILLFFYVLIFFLFIIKIAQKGCIL